MDTIHAYSGRKNSDVSFVERDRLLLPLPTGISATTIPYPVPPARRRVKNVRALSISAGPLRYVNYSRI